MFCVWCEPRLNALNAELNPICHLLALLGARHILHISRIRVKKQLRTALFFVTMQHVVVISYQRFGTTDWSHLDIRILDS